MEVLCLSCFEPLCLKKLTPPPFSFLRREPKITQDHLKRSKKFANTAAI